MFAQVTTFGIRSATITQIVRAFDQEVLPRAREQAGFLKADLLTRSRLNKGVAIFYWDRERDAMEFRKSGGLDDLLAPLGPYLLDEPVTEGYEPNIVSPFPDGRRP